MSIQREEVQKIAALAKLELDEAQIDLYATQLTRILDHIEMLKQLPEETAGEGGPLEPTPLRPDLVANPSDAEFGLAQAPDREGDLFRVPRIIE